MFTRYNLFMVRLLKSFLPASIQFSFMLLTGKARIRLVLSCVALCLIGLLDLLAIGLLAVIASLTLSAINNDATSPKVLELLNFFGILQKSIEFKVVVLAIFMCVLFISRTIVSIYFSNKIYKFLAHQNNLLTEKILTKLLDQDLENLRKLTTQEILFATTSGLNAAVVNINGLLVVTVADLFLSFIMISTLIIFSPLVSVASILILTLLAILLYKIFNARIRQISLMNTEASIYSNSKIIEILETYRESLVRDTRENYIKTIVSLRSQVSESIAAQSILPNITKYTMELTLMIAGITISGVMFFLFDANKALTGLSLFVAVGSRISPAFLRIQQNFLVYRLNQTSLEVTQKLLLSIKSNSKKVEEELSSESFLEFKSSIDISNLYFQYDSYKGFGLTDVSLKIPPGSFTAIVGSSGSGKTTLVDLILGLLTPTSGLIQISEKSPLTVHKQWPGAIAYVPQDVVIVNGSLKENIALGFDVEMIDTERVLKCIKLAHLTNVVNSLPGKLDANLGEKGSKMSGGQRQRVGIARALYTNPSILVLDEATSALDGESEKEINDSLQELIGKITILVISHRLSSVVKADQVLYLEKGRIMASGTFDEVRNLSANFNNQAILMGL
jgi:ABC-type multidrug transport system fused ATPase/permease subunit